jgi:methionyl-tRNA synthetase
MNRYNGELCDVVGNFVHRSLTMTVKNFDGKVPPAGELDAEDTAMLAAIGEQTVDWWPRRWRISASARASSA